MTTKLQHSTFRPAGTPEGLEDLRRLVNQAIDILQEVSASRSGPVAAGGPAGAAAAADRAYEADGFADLVRAYAEWSVDITHPAAVARMQPPPTAAGAAAELVAATLNQSLHAWESGPFALELDRRVVEELAALVGYGPAAGGTLTPGGSVSNLMALVIARDTVVARKLGRLVATEGLAPLGIRAAIVAPAGTHFSIFRAARVLGIGEDNVLAAPVDAAGRLVPEELDAMLASLPDDVLPVAIVACAGSTDLGIVDPLPELAEVARRHGVWLHTDAAYGGGALFSERLRPMLDGLAEADSVTLDLHKFGWAPASSAALLVRREETLCSFGLDPTTCLTSDDDTLAGYIGRQTTSLQTTRRADALKILITLRTLGRRTIGDMVDTCHELALHAAAAIAAEPRLELIADPPLTAVLFRYVPENGDADGVNGTLRRRLMERGRALLARTHAGNTVLLKLMLLNPATTPQQLDELLDEIVATGIEIEQELRT
jgi:L-2,4-diaminobutyrate decarboxylase